MLTEEQILKIRKDIGMPEQGFRGVQKNPAENIARRRLLASEYDKQQEKPDSGFIGGVKKSFSRGLERVGKAQRRELSGEQGFTSSSLQKIGASAGIIGDVFFEGLKAITPEIVEKTVKGEIGAMGEALSVITPDKAEEAMKEKTRKIFTNINQWSKQHPEAAANLESMLDIAGVVPITKGGQLAVKGVRQAGKSVVRGAETGLETSKEMIKKGIEKSLKEKSLKAGAGEVAGFGVSQATGIDRSALKQLIETPEAFTREAIKGVDTASGELARSVKTKIDSRLKALSETGKGYDVIRKSGARIELEPIRLLEEKFKFKIENGKIIATTESITRESSDIKALQKIVDDWGNKSNISVEEFLNFRKDLANLSYKPLGSTKTGASATIGNALRIELNKVRNQVKGLKELDDAFSKETGILKQIKKDYINPNTGEFKDNAIRKIANLTGKGKEQVLERLKGIDPDIEKKINILKALENIKGASGIKVGTYLKSGLTGFGIATGNIPLIIGSIMANPVIAVPLIKRYAMFMKKSKSFTNGIINKLENGKSFIGGEKVFLEKMLNDKSDKIKKSLKESIEDVKKGNIGLTIKDVSKEIEPLVKEARKYKSAEKFVKAKEKDIVYHGSLERIEKFDKRGAFFTDDMMNAEGYASGKNVYEGYLNLKKPLIIDAKGRHHSNLKTPYGKSTQEIVGKVDDKKYDGVIFKNINDSFADDVDIVGSDTIFYPFNANKSFINKSQLIDIWNKANKPTFKTPNKDLLES